MKLSTPSEIPDYPFRLNHHGRIFMLGSCFTDNIGKMLLRYRFPVEINPFGTIFNPLSVQRSLHALLNKATYEKSDLEQHGEQWLSFDHYTGFSDPDPELCLEKINRRFIPAREALGKASLLILSWGTAWVYRKAGDGRPVSNCHRLPSAFFTRSRLTPDEITGLYTPLLKKLMEKRPELKILLTVSPVRHLKDGAHGNQLSKASLLLASEQLAAAYPEQLFYFPSYEIVMDELRDYRFYDSDMAHLNETAIAFIWEKFTDALLEEESREILRDLEPLLRMREHRSRDKGNRAMKLFQEKLVKLEEAMQRKYPFLDL